MARRWFVRLRARKRTLLGCLALAFLLLNALAYRRAYVMTHFVGGGPRAGTSWAALVRDWVGGPRVRRSVNDRTPADVGLAFDVHHVESSDGITLEGWHVPSAAARGLVVMFHGYDSCKANLLAEAAALHRLGYATFLVDFRGHGGSGGMLTTIGFAEADDVARTVEYARPLAGGRPLILYGQSMGSAAVLRAVAVHHVEAAAVVVECPFDRLTSTVGNRLRSVGLPGFPCAQIMVFWGGLQHGFSGFDHNPVDYARAVTCPVLLLQGDRDPLVTLTQARSIFDNLPSAKHLEIFAGLGHESFEQARPGRWEPVLHRFLDRHIHADLAVHTGTAR